MIYYLIQITEAFATTWTKQFCTYQKSTKEFTMIPYNHVTGKQVRNFNKIKPVKILFIVSYFLIILESFVCFTY